MFDIGHITTQNADLVLQTLYKLGVKYFCLAPGSRSTPLALALAKLPKECRCIHFDERGLGFHALGFAKASKTPVVIIVTTGTAVANLFPAIAEASASKVPLILLSADRPEELRDCGANQTMKQVGIFSSFTRWEIDLSLSDPLLPNTYLLSTLSYAVHTALHGKPGPVQINLKIKEPFFSENPNFLPPSSPCDYEPSLVAPPLSSFKKWSALLSSYEKGIILLGEGALDEDATSLLELAEKLNFPIISDILSGGRKIGDHPYHLEYADILIKTMPNLKIDVILQIGGSFVSKTLASWISAQSIPHFLVTNHPFRQDPTSQITHKMECEINLFCSTLSSFLEKKESSWVTFCKTKTQIIKKEVSHFFEKELFSEPYLAHFFKDFPGLFLSNSMPIRDADLFIYPNEGESCIFANRGVSGIDGNIATAIGVAKALKKPLVALLGDIATLHDLNSLALVKKSPVPILFVIINNQGGGIFSFLPIAKKEEILDEFFATEHTYSFEGVAQMFSLPFLKVSSSQELKKALENKHESCIIECSTVRKDNVMHHQTIYKMIEEKLCSFTDLLETKTISL